MRLQYRLIICHNFHFPKHPLDRFKINTYFSQITYNQIKKMGKNKKPLSRSKTLTIAPLGLNISIP